MRRYTELRFPRMKILTGSKQLQNYVQPAAGNECGSDRGKSFYERSHESFKIRIVLVNTITEFSF